MPIFRLLKFDTIILVDLMETRYFQMDLPIFGFVHSVYVRVRPCKWTTACAHVHSLFICSELPSLHFCSHLYEGKPMPTGLSFSQANRQRNTLVTCQERMVRFV